MGAVFVFFLLWLNGVFYGFAAALQNINESSTAQDALSGNKKALRLHRMLKEPTRYINTIPLLVMLCGISFGVYMVPLLRMASLHMLSDKALWLLILICLILICAMGILAFRRIGTFRPQDFAYRYVNLVYGVSFLLLPITKLITLIARGITVPFGVDFSLEQSEMTEEEIISIVDEAHEQGVIEKNEAEMIQNIISFNETQAHDIMTHRMNIKAFDEKVLLQEMCDKMLEEGFSRYPVYEESIDNVVGIVHFKDALEFLTKNAWAKFKPLTELPGLIREASLIPETRSIADLFSFMQLRKAHIAVVIDEYGQTAGIVSMEDILEEIVGDILDEYDEEEARFRRQGTDIVTINAMTHLSDVEQELGISFGETHFETLNGYLTAQLGHIPTKEDLDKEIITCGYRFKILSLGNRTIGNVRAMREGVGRKDAT